VAGARENVAAKIWQPMLPGAPMPIPLWLLFICDSSWSSAYNCTAPIAFLPCFCNWLSACNWLVICSCCIAIAVTVMLIPPQVIRLVVMK
jgi:hypothetical protein